MTPNELERCPVCAADLRDRPPPAACPECGFAYDADTRIWRSSETWARLACIYAAVGVIVGLVTAVLYRVQFGHVPNAAFALLLAAAFPTLGLALRRVVGGRVSGRFVAVAPAGIVLGTRGRPTVVPWGDFERLVERRGVLRIQRASTAELAAVDDIFATPAQAGAFREAVGRAAAAFRRGAGDGGTAASCSGVGGE